MATPGDALRAQAEARLKVLARRVAAHRKVKNAHYTAFVRARDGSDSWTYHDRRSAVAVGSFANVVQRCRDGPMLPYLLFYDSLTAAPGA